MEIYRMAFEKERKPRILTGRLVRRTSDGELFKVVAETLSGNSTGVVLENSYDNSCIVAVDLLEFFAAYTVMNPGE